MTPPTQLTTFDLTRRTAAPRGLRLGAGGRLLTLGIFSLLVRMEDAERATAVLLRARPADTPWFFMPIDEWLRKSLPYRLASSVYYDGKERLDRGEYAAAIGYFDVAAQLDPTSDILGARAYAWLKRGQSEKARADFAKALELCSPELQWTIPYYEELKAALSR